jgi:hypothetical protein
MEVGRTTLCAGPSFPENKTLLGTVKECVVVLEQMVRVALEDCSGRGLLQQRVRIPARIPARIDQAVIGIEFDHGGRSFGKVPRVLNAGRYPVCDVAWWQQMGSHGASKGSSSRRFNKRPHNPPCAPPC